jgi:hypothetical protein
MKAKNQIEEQHSKSDHARARSERQDAEGKPMEPPTATDREAPAATCDVTDELKREIEEILQKRRPFIGSEMEASYGEGELVIRVRKDKTKSQYGQRAMEQLEFDFGKDKRQLYDLGKIADTWAKAEFLSMTASGHVCIGHLAAIVRLKDPAMRKEQARLLDGQHMTVEGLREHIRRLLPSRKPRSAAKSVRSKLEHVVSALTKCTADDVPALRKLEEGDLAAITELCEQVTAQIRLFESALNPAPGTPDADDTAGAAAPTQHGNGVGTGEGAALT